MNDKFIKFVSKGIYTSKIITIPHTPGKLSLPERYIKLELSIDMINEFCESIKNKKINRELEATIYDEGIASNRDDRAIRKKLIKTLNKLKFRKINFILSDSTLPIYNQLMSELNWQHKLKTTISMKIDRNPTATKTRDWYLDKSMGTPNIPEEKLVWLPDNEISKLHGIIDEKVLQDTEKLKKLLLYLEEYLNETYQFRKMNDFAKILAIYKFLKINIRQAKSYIEIINGREILKPDHPSYILEPYGTWINKEGLSQGQARLMTVLLNNPIINIDATTIYGKIDHNPAAWVGFVLDNKLYQCCTTKQGPFKNLDILGYKIEESIQNKQTYPTIYEHSFLEENEIKKIEKKLKSLKK